MSTTRGRAIVVPGRSARLLRAGHLVGPKFRFWPISDRFSARILPVVNGGYRARTGNPTTRPSGRRNSATPKMASPERFATNIRGPADFIPVPFPLLLRHHLARQLARHHFAYLTALLCRFEHGLSRAIMLGGNGCRFCVYLIDRRKVGIHVRH